jgi:hypothetical protein
MPLAIRQSSIFLYLSKFNRRSRANCQRDIAVRGSPDPARRLTEGLHWQRFALIV